MVREYWSDGRIARRLRETFGRREGFVYILYAEPHQREHFLGPEGLLQPFRAQVVARDWREDVLAARNRAHWQEFPGTPEGALLHRFEITELREHLPFVAVVGRRSGLKPFKLSQAYRARRRDGGKALRSLEEQMVKAISKTFAVQG